MAGASLTITPRSHFTCLVRPTFGAFQLCPLLCPPPAFHVFWYEMVMGAVGAWANWSKSLSTTDVQVMPPQRFTGARERYARVRSDFCGSTELDTNRLRIHAITRPNCDRI